MEKGEITAEEGSSPLARGLPLEPPTTNFPYGIIPARAGFTSGLMPIIHAAKDHPRSRGVYPTSPRRPVSPAGSSPLARGLPLEPPAWEGHSRIIPARAGFTQRVSWP